MRNNRGFTLVELLMVLSLMGILLSLIITPILFASKSFVIQNEKALITSNLRKAMDYITRQIRMADTVELINETTLKINSSIYTVNNRNLVKDGNVVITGIDDIKVNKDEEEISVEIIIIDRKGNNNSLSSKIYLR